MFSKIIPQHCLQRAPSIELCLAPALLPQGEPDGAQEPGGSGGPGVTRAPCCEGLPAGTIQSGLADSDACEGWASTGNGLHELGGTIRSRGNRGEQGLGVRQWLLGGNVGPEPAELPRSPKEKPMWHFRNVKSVHF